MVFGLRLGLPNRKSSVAEPPPSGEPAPASGSKTGLTVNEFVARTKKARDKGLEPTKPELISYAKYLGIDPVIDGDLMWIADEALKAPLPCEWTEHHDSAERIFYYNVDTHDSSWTHPLEQLHRDTYKSIVNFRSGALSREDQIVELEKLRTKCEQSEREAHQELQSWTEHSDEQGQKFYFKKSNGRSVWTDPRPARCHSLYLQMKALRVLGRHCGQTVTPRGFSEPGRPGVREASDDIMSLTSNCTPFGAGGKSPSAAGEQERRSKKSKKDGKIKNRGNKCAGLTYEDVKEEMKRSFQKPQLSGADDVRGGLGTSASLPLLGSGSPMGDNGLSNVGRARVRAGIRLEPIKGGA
mmetsp:Transcript_33978/g.97742  ORF Transcript_33978/g.97742 Transcript_33978/m.97742 type:complete len:354 (-) Transcript_33978:14-1075(-)